MPSKSGGSAPQPPLPGDYPRDNPDGAVPPDPPWDDPDGAVPPDPAIHSQDPTSAASRPPGQTSIDVPRQSREQGTEKVTNQRQKEAEETFPVLLVVRLGNALRDGRLCSPRPSELGSFFGFWLLPSPNTHASEPWHADVASPGARAFPESRFPSTGHATAALPGRRGRTLRTQDGDCGGDGAAPAGNAPQCYSARRILGPRFRPLDTSPSCLWPQDPGSGGGCHAR